MYVYTCTTHTHMYIYIFIHACKCMYIRTYIYICTRMSFTFLMLYIEGHKPYKITFSSDYFGQLYSWAVELIKRYSVRTYMYIQCINKLCRLVCVYYRLGDFCVKNILSVKILLSLIFIDIYMKVRICVHIPMKLKNLHTVEILHLTLYLHNYHKVR